LPGENGLISGYGNGKLGPNDATTWQQAMAMIARAVQVTKLEAKLTKTDIGKAADYANPCPPA